MNLRIHRSQVGHSYKKTDAKLKKDLDKTQEDPEMFQMNQRAKMAITKKRKNQSNNLVEFLEKS